MSELLLVIGNRNYSSWSLRAWLVMKLLEVPFTEHRIALHTDRWRREIGRSSPTGRVPVLWDAGRPVWDSLAIAEHVSACYAAGRGWPADPAARALARSAVCEMHSGFVHLREELPLNCRRRPAAVPVSDAAAADVARIETLWSELRERAAPSGPWLFGDLGIADAVFAPVALRLHAYAIPLDGPAGDYAGALLELPAVREWCRLAEQESEWLAEYEK